MMDSRVQGWPTQLCSGFYDTRACIEGQPMRVSSLCLRGNESNI